MPSFISLTSEYAPKQHRATIVGLLWAGFPLGGVLGGLLASQLIPAYGWQSLFWVGGILPILLTILLFIALPESIGFLVSSGAPRERIVRILARVCPGWVLPAGARFTLGEEKAEAASIRELFSPGRSGGTALLWVSFFFTFMILVTNTAWAPTLLRGEGVAVAQSAFVMAIFNLGSVAGTSLAGYLVTRFGASAILPAAFIGATASLAMVGQSGPSIPLVILFQGLLGFCLGAGSSGLIALGALFLSDGHPLHRARLGHGHGPVRLLRRPAHDRVARGMAVADRDDLSRDRATRAARCRHGRAGGPAKGRPDSRSEARNRPARPLNRVFAHDAQERVSLAGTRPPSCERTRYEHPSQARRFGPTLLASRRLRPDQRARTVVAAMPPTFERHLQRADRGWRPDTATARDHAGHASARSPDPGQDLGPDGGRPQHRRRGDPASRCARPGREAPLPGRLPGFRTRTDRGGRGDGRGFAPQGP